MASIPDPSCDIISSLPGNIMETILLRLPIRDAVRTSILSRKWRYSWVTFPELVFDDTLCQESMENNSSAQTKLFAFTIFKILLLHHGPVLKFTLSISGLESCSEIDQSILFLSRNGVEEFTLQLSKGDHYKLPASLFSWIQLRHLNLRRCVFKPPPKFEGFIRLKSLELSDFIVCRETIESLISTCLLLEKLILRRSAAVFENLEINAPNLKYLTVWDVTKLICFKNVTFLAEVSIGAADPPEVLNGAETCNLINVFASLAVIENLHMNYSFVKFCAVGGVPKRLSTTLVNLKVLFLSAICFSELDEVSCTLCLIRSSPNLQKITIKVFVDIDRVTGPVIEFLEEQHYSNIVLEKLQEVKMENVSGIRPELEFIKFLLAKSPVLEKMLINPKTMKADEGLKMLLETIRFRRLSANAEIICKDPVGNQV